MNPSDLTTVEILTDRLRLIPISLQWTEEIFKEFTLEITRYMTPQPAKEIQGTKAFIHDSLEQMKQGVTLQQVILLKDTNEFLGCAGAHHMETKHPALGVWIKKSAHGNGYGREAITGIKQWIDAHYPYDHLLYPVDRDNIASRKIPESLGGIIHDTYQKTTESEDTLNTVEYRIYPST